MLGKDIDQHNTQMVGRLVDEVTIYHFTIVPVTASLHNTISFRYGTFIVMARVFSALLMVSLEEKSQCSIALLTATSTSAIGHSWIGVFSSLP